MRINSKRISANKAFLFSLVVLVLFLTANRASAGTVLFEIIDANSDSSLWGRGDNSLHLSSISEKYVPQANQTVCAVYHKVGREPDNPGIVLSILSFTEFINTHYRKPC